MPVPTLKDQRAADIDRMYDPDLPWVEPAASGGVSFSARMVYEPNPAGAETHGGAYLAGRAVCLVRKAELADPAAGTQITVVGENWRVAEKQHANASEWRLVLERNVRSAFRE